MPLRLTKTPDEIRKQFAELKTPRDVASLLEIEYSRLVYHIHKTKPAARYSRFSIPKKGGGHREIWAPVSPLKIIQRKANHILQQVYRAKHSVHGFLPSKSIVTNAKVHTNRTWILRVDLSDFFPSINFGRVRGMFRANPYNLNTEVATVLAQIACFNKRLPQGAPSSPIISNMICAKMDSELQRLARKHKCRYTRYADDLTFSTNRSPFPRGLAVMKKVPSGTKVMVGSELRERINGNGFGINEEKVRLQHRSARQVVTGLRANEFPNVPRTVVRQVRAMLHAWEKFGLDNARKVFESHYALKYRNPERYVPSFEKVVKGKIDFIGMVRGKTDRIHLQFLKKLRTLKPDLVRHIPPSDYRELIRSALWVIESVDPISETLRQGTAFRLAGYGLITCNHVLGPETYVYRADNPDLKLRATVIAKDDTVDLAILEIEDTSGNELVPAEGTALKEGDQVIIGGYPNFAPGHTGTVKDGRVVGRHAFYSPPRMLVDTAIVTGTSGGPVLDRIGNRVVGIAVTGSDSEETVSETERHGVIPLVALRKLRID